MVGQEQAAMPETMPISVATAIISVMSALQNRAAAAGSIIMPDRQQRAERVEAADEVQDDEAEEDEVRRRARPADRAQKGRVDAFEHERAVQQRPAPAA